jgi:hypothetical protein
MATTEAFISSSEPFNEVIRESCPLKVLERHGVVA